MCNDSLLSSLTCWCPHIHPGLRSCLQSETALEDLDQYPEEPEVHKYLHKRLMAFDLSTLYELHYLMITLGKASHGECRAGERGNGRDAVRRERGGTGRRGAARQGKAWEEEAEAKRIKSGDA